MTEGWSSRTLDRNISKQYYYRLLQSPKKDAVIEEMKQKTEKYQKTQFELLKSQVIAEFLGFGQWGTCIVDGWFMAGGSKRKSGGGNKCDTLHGMYYRVYYFRHRNYWFGSCKKRILDTGLSA